MRIQTFTGFVITDEAKNAVHLIPSEQPAEENLTPAKLAEVGVSLGRVDMPDDYEHIIYRVGGAYYVLTVPPAGGMRRAKVERYEDVM